MRLKIKKFRKVVREMIETAGQNKIRHSRPGRSSVSAAYWAGVEEGLRDALDLLDPDQPAPIHIYNYFVEKEKR